MEEAPLSIRLLGGFEVRVGGRPMRSVRARSVEWLLALLVLRHGRDVSRSWLAGTLWPESSEAQAFVNLRRNLMELRQALGAEAERLRTPSRATLGLDLTGAAADVVCFDAAIAAGDAGSLQAAVALYRGPLLEGCTEEWVFAERGNRAEACLQALETLAERAAERGDPAAALGYLSQAAALDPLRDSTQRRRMEALAASGDLPAALLTYREHRLRLHRELNVEPDPETTRLFQQLRSGVRRTTLRRPPPHAGSLEPAAHSPDLASRPADRDTTPEPAPAIHPPEAEFQHRPAPLPRPLTTLIGRDQEVREVVASVRASRLVTLVGGGGVGKTRLAIQAAEELAADFPAGVAFVELASLADPALLPGDVAAALDVREADAAAGTGPEALVQALSGWLTLHPVLLVLDNCEHLVQVAAALIHALLSACPALRILTTSRQRLGLTGEAVWRVPSLPTPDPDHLPADEPSAVEAVLSYPAAQLFAERAAAARAEFRLTEREEAMAVARICWRLDGIPLALGLLTPAQIAARLDDRFRLLTGGSRVALPRQQTLRALIDWSYDLLPQAERTLLCRLSVFAGGWTLEEAEAICGGEGCRVWGVGCRDGESSTRHPTPHTLHPDVLDLLSALEEKSLVLVELREGAIRYRMLETVREYAREKLAESGELAAVRNRHRDWCLQFVEQVAADPSEPIAVRARLEAELDNLRAALAWCQEAAEANPGSDAAEAGRRLAVALYRLWLRYGYLLEDPASLERALVRDTAAPAQLRALAYFFAAEIAVHVSRSGSATFYLQSARQAYEEVLTQARREGDRSGAASALLALASVMHKMGDLDAAWGYGLEARQSMEELGDRPGIVEAVKRLSLVTWASKGLSAARSWLEEWLELSRELGSAGDLMAALGTVGHLMREDGNFARARSLYQESLALRRELGHGHAVGQSLEDLAVLAGLERQSERAIRLLGAGEAFCETIGVPVPVALVAEYERTVAEARAALGEAGFAAVWAEGRAMSLEQVVEYALREA